MSVGRCLCRRRSSPPLAFQGSSPPLAFQGWLQNTSYGFTPHNQRTPSPHVHTYTRRSAARRRTKDVQTGKPTYINKISTLVARSRLLHAVRVRDEGAAAVGVVIAAAAAPSSVVFGRQDPRVEHNRLEVLVVLDRGRQVAEVVDEVAEVYQLFVSFSHRIDRSIDRSSDKNYTRQCDNF